MPTEQFQNRMHERQVAKDDPASVASRCLQLTEDSIRDNPMLVTVAAFGLGVGLGALIGSRLVEPASPSRRQTAEMLGRRMLDSIAEALPESVRRYVA